MTRLRPEDIKYIALEGGGGKGNALIGALKALEKRGALSYDEPTKRYTNVKGFAGASAGAITALFLACGYTHEEITRIQEMEDFNLFFDEPNLGKESPRFGGCRQVLVGSIRDASLFQVFQEFLTNYVKVISSGESAGVGTILSSLNNPITQLYVITKILQRAARNSRLELPESVRRRLFKTDESGKFIASESLHQEFGLFPGCYAREFFQKWIAIAWLRTTNPSQLSETQNQEIRDIRRYGDLLEQLNERYNRALVKLNRRKRLPESEDIPTELILDSVEELLMMQYRQVKFNDFERHFDIKLVVMGSNLETFKSIAFSSKTTPQFYVADAVRISMSLPFIFKPLIIRQNPSVDAVPGVPPEIPVNRIAPTPQEERRGAIPYKELIGVWVDGGIFNNIPITIFDREPEGPGKTLGIRLDKDEPIRNLSGRPQVGDYDPRRNRLRRPPEGEIWDFGDYFKAFPLSMPLNAGETHTAVTRDIYDQSLTIDVGELGLLDFKPRDPQHLVIAKRNAEREVNNYFDSAGDLTSGTAVGQSQPRPTPRRTARQGRRRTSR